MAGREWLRRRKPWIEGILLGHVEVRDALHTWTGYRRHRAIVPPGCTGMSYVGHTGLCWPLAVTGEPLGNTCQGNTRHQAAGREAQPL